MRYQDCLKTKQEAEAAVNELEEQRRKIDKVFVALETDVRWELTINPE